MPSKTEKQRNYIFYLRGKYKSKDKTPDKDKWIWDSGWEQVEEQKMERYKRKFDEQNTDYIIDEKVREIISILRDNNYGNEQSRKELLSLLTQLHNSKDRTARKAFKKIGDLFTDIGDELIGEVGNKDEE